MKNHADSPLHVRIENEQLVISIGIERLASVFEESEDNQVYNEESHDYDRVLRITDKQEFAKDVVSAMREESENGSTPLYYFLMAMCQAAADDGSTGVDYDE